MRSNVEFRSPALLDTQSDAGTPRGEAVARLLAEHLAHSGYSVDVVEPEDWGWRVQLHNTAFPLWIGCGHYEEYPDGHLCFIEPSKRHVGRWWKRIPTEEAVERLAAAVEQILLDSGTVSNLRWWTATENARG